MKNLWWLALTVGSLLYPVKSLALSPVLDCGWCGNSCGEVRPGIVCPMVAPPDNQSCVNLSGKCVIQEKKVVKEGEVCGGIVGAICDNGLFCKYSDGVDKMAVRDGSGICVKDGSGGPICIPRPACMDGIEDPTTGKMFFCDPPSGVNICPVEVKGDANRDGRVDLIDFTIWKKEYLSGGKPAIADFNKDGKVDLVDFTIWKSSYLINKK